MIAIIDYGMGNLRSVQKAFEFLGFDASVTSDSKDIINASHIVLPGVGAFADAARCLENTGVQETMVAQIKKGKPFLGICLGMQLLFDRSFENGEHKGLSLIPGDIVEFDVKGLKVPHMGWNTLAEKSNALFDGEGEEKYVYFVHSYHPANVPEEYVIAKTDYGYTFPSAVAKDNIFGLQFHPEKSSETGLDMLKRFGELT